MHRRIINEALLTLRLATAGPLLVRAVHGGADPTRPETEFVRTDRAGGETIYLPGSSLRGALRTHCERIARTVGGTGPDGRPRLACNPLSNVADGPNYSCNRRLADLAAQARGRELGGPRAYRESCAVCQLFGNAAVAGRLAVADAYPVEAPRLEPRAGIALDRIYGSVADGPFAYEVATAAHFETTLTLWNFTTPQLGLLALALRDLAAGRVVVGSGKSRGLGRLTVDVQSVTLRYPGCVLSGEQLATLAGHALGPAAALHGAGAFPDSGGYGFPAPDTLELPPGATVREDGWGVVEVQVPTTDGALADLWRACTRRWADAVRALAGAS